MNNLLGNLPPVVKNLLIINVVCFIGSLIFTQAPRLFGVFYPDSPFFHIWQPITYMFMHDNLGFAHIFFNMFSLVMFGPIVERVLGSKKFLNYYLICGLGALVLQYGVQAIEVYQITGTVQASDYVNFDMLNDRIYSTKQISQENFNTLASIYGTPLVGASGAIYGLLLAFAVLFPNMELMLLFIPVPIKAKYFIPILIVIEVYLGFSRGGSSIAHLAHVGGALFGFILLKMWGVRRGNYY
ncbi:MULTISPECIES: rhomboid family intramembrane serine protease [Sphingobacterium]|uniref:Rhomboid family intramembrane serine protease n=1 Tax=Sphingobacterium hotanense TaxID=649196 RepID=A0ABT7NR91_9SPHI|nr:MULTISPECIES: rhomboid family intramembrane serine protease [Sphingobacterium]MCT1526575.1 rhomboid family intramembrane serine protease [Sphingobacterium hotanense]MDM1049684.1 rhomboid family intramembrane serine protease [Sphingobacterium hotanense]